jgi:putative holliday junction resolvase
MLCVTLFLKVFIGMSKIVALDLGDQWTGIALSDASRLLAKPYTTVDTAKLEAAIEKLLDNETITTVVVGYPKTMKGTLSEQTCKVLELKEKLAQRFPLVEWVLWDERLSSKRAEAVGTRKTKEDKLKLHAIAAAFILDSYLAFLSFTQKQ